MRGMWVRLKTDYNGGEVLVNADNIDYVRSAGSKSFIQMSGGDLLVNDSVDEVAAIIDERLRRAEK